MRIANAFILSSFIEPSCSFSNHGRRKSTRIIFNDFQTQTQEISFEGLQPERGGISSIDASRSTFSFQKKSTLRFPTRIQDVLNDSLKWNDRESSSSTVSYRSIVPRLYLRHIVVETRDMAVIALHTYQQQLRNTSNTSVDPFGDVARLLSTDSITADNGGTIGWIDTSSNIKIMNDSTISSSGVDSPEIFSPSVISAHLMDEICNHRPKAGDTCIVHNPDQQLWHLVLIAELWLQPGIFRNNSSINTHLPLPGKFPNAITATESFGVGTIVGQNRLIPRGNRKFKGRGIAPEFPFQLKTYKIQTSGCQMNVADSERLEGILVHDLLLQSIQNDNNDKESYTPSSVSSSKWPDVLVLNTCSIRNKAEQKVYDALGPYCDAKRRGQRIVVIVTGCVAQQEGEILLSRIPEVDAVIGPQYIPFLKNVVRLVSTGQQVVATSPMIVAEPDVHIPPVRGHDVRAWVNVIYGCNEHCSYCVVPATRGIEQSRPMEAILFECIELASRGYKEITLIGQNIDAYGRDMIPKRTFADLLYFLNGRLPDAMRIRYVTSHPRYFGERVIDAVASLDKVCECYHMPFQAGDDEVLKRMRRGYTSGSYLKIIQRIREKAPDAAITTDIIVGFPGETEEAFQRTLHLMETVKFDNVNSFAYSPRPNTEAALWTDHMIPNDIKANRLQRVQRLAAEHGLERSSRYVGRIVEVLVEDSNHRNSRQVMGRTRQGRQVYFDGSFAQLRGKFIQVRILQARTWSLIGESVSQ